MDIKSKSDKIATFLESCFDEHQTRDDGLTFDERVRSRMMDLPEDEKKIVEDAIS